MTGRLSGGPSSFTLVKYGSGFPDAGCLWSLASGRACHGFVDSQSGSLPSAT